MAKRVLTKTAIDELPVTGKQSFLWDVNPPGFGVRISPAGVKSYIYQFRIGGRAGENKRTTIGRHGELTVEQARKLAHRLAESVRGKVDPVEAEREALRQKAERKATEKELAFDAYSATYLKNRVTPEGLASYGNIEMVFRLHAIPVLKSKPLPAITKRDMVAVLDSIPAESLALRRSTYAILNRLMNWAVGRGDLSENPMAGMKRPPAPDSRDRVLSDDELALALRAAGAMAMPFGPFYQVIFATGQRRDEVAGLSWAELDRAKALWTLPASRTKNGEANLVPLNRHAIAALDQAAAASVAAQAVTELERDAKTRGRKILPAERARVSGEAKAAALAEYPSGARKWPAKGLVLSGTGETPISGYSRAKTRLDADMLALARKDAKAAGDDPEAVELDPWRLHDARRTLATGLQRLGVRFEVTEAVLNHTAGASRSGVAAVYQRHGWGPEKRAALDAWADHCDRAVSPPVGAGNVVALRPGA